MILLIFPAFYIVGVVAVVTALASIVNTPTPRSVALNLFLGAAGYVVGFIVGMARAKVLPRDNSLIDSTALWTAVLACAVHEFIRWSWRRSQHTDEA